MFFNRKLSYPFPDINSYFPYHRPIGPLSSAMERLRPHQFHYFSTTLGGQGRPPPTSRKSGCDPFPFWNVARVQDITNDLHKKELVGGEKLGLICEYGTQSLVVIAMRLEMVIKREMACEEMLQ